MRSICDDQWRTARRELLVRNGDGRAPGAPGEEAAATPDPGLWGSLVASLLASGTPSVVASLWSTPDRVSRELSERFYAEGGARDPAGALARTQRAWLAEGRPVADWASFAFYGPGPSRAASLAASTAR